MGVCSCILTAGNIEESTRALNYINHKEPSSTAVDEEQEDVEGETKSTANQKSTTIKKSDANANSNTLTLYSTVGVHPTRCNEFTDKGVEVVMGELESLLLAGKQTGQVVAVGEAGLDYDRLHFCDKEQQMSGFLKQIELAAK